jgi:virginiamycin B lyase
MTRLGIMLAALVAISTASGMAHAKMAMQTFPVLAGAGPHDVYPTPDGTVWFTAQSSGKLGRLDPRNGKSDFIALGPGAAPHAVIVAPDGAAWVTEGGQNALARVDPATRAVKLFPLPKERRNANLNTASFDRQGILWFTGQNGVYGRLDPKSGAIAVFDAPRGTGPYGIAATPDGQVFFASLAGNYLGQIDLETGGVTVLEPPVPRQGARRVWSDRHGALWITGWTSGDLFRFDSKAKSWAHWHLPGDGPQPYAVYVDETDAVWVSD